MTWTPTSPDTIGYEVRYALNSPTPSYTYVTTVSTNITINGVLNGETYVVGIRAICDGNIYSEWTGRRIVVCDNNHREYVMEGYAVNNETIVFGSLYNWYTAADSRIVESGWHVATNSEWNELAISLGGNYELLDNPTREKVKNVTDKMKLSTIWAPGYNEGNNSSEMNIAPSGVVTDLGVSTEKYSTAIFWCYDEQNSLLGKYKKFSNENGEMYRNINYFDKHYGFSIRLVKDDPTGWVSSDVYVDYDGNVYPTKLMPDGNVWITQNLRVQNYNDSSPIPVNPTDWSTTSVGGIHTYG